MGIANSGTTMIGRWKEGLLDLKVVGRISIGIMHQHLEVMGSFCAGDVGTSTPLEVAVASVGSFVSVTPAVGMVGG